MKILANNIRKDIVNMIFEAGSGHLGGSLSLVEFLTALYFEKLKHDPDNPDWQERDRVILSKGHAAPVLYSVLARAGYFPVKHLLSLRKLNSDLEGHPNIKTPGIEVGTGSLGQGLSIGCGLALSFKKKMMSNITYVIMGDGELQEGQNWEAAMFAGNNNLNNLVAFVDWNDLQIDGKVSEVNGIEPLEAKWKAFNWNTRVIDGHNIDEIIKTLNSGADSVKPLVIIGKTIKGKGISFMEDKAEWHGKPLNKELYIKAMEQLEIEI
ncbi:MAG: transketolase [Candidatus Delongbacteria bacterium]|nr:transketolase [Candidatus Delongbacteria bacterium]